MGCAPSRINGSLAAVPDVLPLLQINKNWMVKARVGSDSAAAAVGLRLWHAVSAYATACVHLDYATRTPRWVISGRCSPLFLQLHFR